MGVEIMHDEKHDRAVMFCNTSDFAFGPVFQSTIFDEKGPKLTSKEVAFLFVAWVWKVTGMDVREFRDSDLEATHGKFLTWIEKQAKDATFTDLRVRIANNEIE